MSRNQPQTPMLVLATDLDGTLIPLDGNEQNRTDLQTLRRELLANDVTLVFSTGRHFDSVMHAIAQFELPAPDWIICDVGTSLFARRPSGDFEPVAAYQTHLDSIVSTLPIVELRRTLRVVKDLRIQEDKKQGRFKLSYYTRAELLSGRVHEIQGYLDRINAPYSIVQSVDPFNGDGLIDLLPAGVSKAYALAWWSDHAGLHANSIVFAGDSGNDLAALTSGCRAIVVGNADRSLARRVYDLHRQRGWQGRLFVAKSAASSGVLEGCRWFGLASQGKRNVAVERLGATPLSCDETHFRVWAPKRVNVSVEVSGAEIAARHPLQRSEFGYFSGTVSGVGVGADYQYVLDEQSKRPDPASRFQPEGVHGASRVIDPNAFPWTDQTWRGVAKRDLIIYELHIGAFTVEGTFRAAIDRLEGLIELGITAVEIMPVAQSPGRWNWGYDGVNLFAVRNTYGHPDDFKAFVDACHSKGIAVILDVVYNHVGPEGNYLSEFAPYFSSKHRTPWGDSFNFDARHSRQVRQFIVDNAISWLDEFHLDGLRFDAIHFLIDDSVPSIIDDIRSAVAEFSSSAHRNLHSIAETNLYDVELLTENEHRPAYDAIWCDCLMHSIYSFAVPKLRLTQRAYRGASDIAAALRNGFVYAGREPERLSDQQSGHFQSGVQNDLHIDSLITAIQTHDSVGNHPHGMRLHQLTSKAFQRAAASLMLLYPSIPMLFMGEESSADSPFPFFVDFQDRQLRSAVDRGRMQEYAQHDWRNAPLPSAAETFYQAKYLDPNHCDRDTYAWYRQLISLRKSGLSEGWLSCTRLTTAYDDRRAVFTVRYQCDDGGAIVIWTRLTAPDSSDTIPLAFPRHGQVLLSSEPIPDRSHEFLQLQPNHAVISRVV